MILLLGSWLLFAVALHPISTDAGTDPKRSLTTASVRSILTQHASRCDVGFEQLCVLVFNRDLGFYGLPFRTTVPALYHDSVVVNHDANTGNIQPATHNYALTIEARSAAVFSSGDSDWSRLGRQSDDQVNTSNLALRLASLMDLHVLQIHHAKGSNRIVSVRWTANVAYSDSYKRWFASLPPRSSYGVDGIRHHVLTGTGMIWTGFSYGRHGWTYDPTASSSAQMTLSRSTILTYDAAIALFIVAMIGLFVLLAKYAPWIPITFAILASRDLQR